MLQTFNYHAHTKRCGHAVGEDEEYVLEAIKNGYRQIGFSDHAPYTNDHTPGERMDKEDFYTYVDSVRKLQEKYQDQIEIRLGLEIEYYTNRMEDLKEYRKVCDYIIIGQHDAGLHERDFYESNTDEDVLEYARLICTACEDGLVDIIAHPDLFMFSKPGWSKACEKATRMLCECACKHKIPLEINLAGLRYGKKQIGDEYRYTYPYRAFWQIASEYPIQAIYGLDAHAPEKYADFKCFDIVNEEILYNLDIPMLKELSFVSKK